MATVSRWVIFWRAFLVTLLFGATVGPNDAEANNIDDADWRLAQRSCSAEGYLWYLRRNPAGKHLMEALTMLTALGVRTGGAVVAECDRGLTGAAPAAGTSFGGRAVY